MSATTPRVRPRLLKSTPCPGFSGSEPSRSAWVPWPWVRRYSIVACFEVPAGRPLLIYPEKMMFVALPRTFGPHTEAATDPVAHSALMASQVRSGRSRERVRRNEPLKSFGFSMVGPFIHDAGPRACAAGAAGAAAGVAAGGAAARPSAGLSPFGVVMLPLPARSAARGRSRG